MIHGRNQTRSKFVTQERFQQTRSELPDVDFKKRFIDFDAAAASLQLNAMKRQSHLAGQASKTLQTGTKVAYLLGKTEDSDLVKRLARRFVEDDGRASQEIDDDEQMASDLVKEMTIKEKLFETCRSSLLRGVKPNAMTSYF
jgi:hypothetical protein